MNSGRLPPAIIVGTGAVTLGIINDLAIEQVPVIHVSTKPDDVALRSRWPQEKVVLDPRANLATSLLELTESRQSRWSAGCLIPTTDPTVRVISQHLDVLTEDYVTPVIPWKELRTTVNKGELYAAAAAAGISVPAILQPGELGDAAQWSKNVGFPIIVKPTETPVFFRAFGKKAIEVNDRNTLLTVLDSIRHRNIEVMLSEIIPGAATNLKAYRAYTNCEGQVIAEMYSEKVRSHPPDYGVGIVQRTIPVDAELQRLGRQLTRALGLSGYATTEFKLDPRDQQFKLMEINPRPAMVQLLFRAAGINFGHITYLDCIGEPLEEHYSYDPGVYSIYNTVDLFYLVRSLKRGFPGIREYFSPYFKRRKALLVPPVRDPKPFFFEMKRMFGGKLRRIVSPNPGPNSREPGPARRRPES